jgi:hypothetical protein
MKMIVGAVEPNVEPAVEPNVEPELSEPLDVDCATICVGT